MPLQAGEIFAGYRIVRLLGSGGMGEVYLAEHPRLPRHNALKVLPADVSADPDYRARFNREADLASKLWHAHIVSVHDRGEHDGQLWISMDFVDGFDAARLLADRFATGMPTDEAIGIVTAVAGALDYAHKRGLLHRDVKPANIMLTHVDDDDDEQRILLTDFGIARSIGDISGLTATNMTLGTVAYSAPEQLMGEELDGRSDQYALAATAYHLIAGQQLFPHSNPAVAIGRHLNAPPPALADSHPELSRFDPVFAVALAKSPENRFPRCGDFALALAEQASGHGSRSSFTITRPAVRASPESTRQDDAAPPAGIPAHRPRLHVPTATGSGVAIAAALTVVLLLGVVALAWRPWDAKQPAASSARTSSPPMNSSESPSTSAPALAPLPPVAPSTTTATVAAAPPAPALPVALPGSQCNPDSTPPIDPNGHTVYCAWWAGTEGYAWSETPGNVALPPGLVGYKPLEACIFQMGWSRARCQVALAQATYKGDGHPYHGD
jgi:serine/threonine protein kinase, bacterial